MGTCLYCDTGYFLNPSSSTEQFCFPCMEGCDRCDNEDRCTVCRTDGYFMEDYFCLKCDHGCKTCSDSLTCDECFDRYFMFDGHCSVLRLQVYIVGACLVLLVALLIACCAVALKKPRPDASFYQASTQSLKSDKTFKSFTVLDDDAKKDRTKIQDVTTIGVIGRGGLSFIESKHGGESVVEDPEELKRKQHDFMKSFAGGN